jgi:hypothetical protein
MKWLLIACLSTLSPAWFSSGAKAYGENGASIEFLKGRARGEHVFLRHGKVYVFVKDRAQNFRIEGESGEVEWHILGNYLVIEADVYPVRVFFGDGRIAKVDADIDGVREVRSVVSVPTERLDRPDDTIHHRRPWREEERTDDPRNETGDSTPLRGLIEVDGRPVEGVPQEQTRWKRFAVNDRKGIEGAVRGARGALTIRGGSDVASAKMLIEIDSWCRKWGKKCTISYDGGQPSFIQMRED